MRASLCQSDQCAELELGERSGDPAGAPVQSLGQTVGRLLRFRQPTQQRRGIQRQRRHGGRCGPYRQQAQEILRFKDDVRSLLNQAVRAAAARTIERPGRGGQVPALLERVPRGPRTAARFARLDDPDQTGQAADRRLSSGETWGSTGVSQGCTESNAPPRSSKRLAKRRFCEGLGWSTPEARTATVRPLTSSEPLWATASTP